MKFSQSSIYQHQEDLNLKSFFNFQIADAENTKKIQNDIQSQKVQVKQLYSQIQQLLQSTKLLSNDPLLTTYPFELKEINNQNVVEVHPYTLTLTQTKLKLGLLFAHDMGEVPDFFILNDSKKTQIQTQKQNVQQQQQQNSNKDQQQSAMQIEEEQQPKDLNNSFDAVSFNADNEFKFQTSNNNQQNQDKIDIEENKEQEKQLNNNKIIEENKIVEEEDDEVIFVKAIKKSKEKTKDLENYIQYFSQDQQVIKQEDDPQLERVVIKQYEKIQISEEILKQIFEYTIKMNAELYQIQKQKLYDNFPQFQQIYQKGAQRNYMICPLFYKEEVMMKEEQQELQQQQDILNEQMQNEEEKDSDKFESLIDWDFLKSFCFFKQQSINISKSSITNKLLTYSEEELLNYYDNVIIASAYGINCNYYILDFVKQPDEDKAIIYLKKLHRLFNNKKTLEEVMNMLNINEQVANEITVNQFLYEYDVGQIESIMFFRKLDQKYNIKTDKKSPIVMAAYLNHVNQFDYTHKQRHNAVNTLKKPNFEISSPNVNLMRSQFLIEFLLTIPDYERFCRIPSLCTKFERIILANELKIYYDFQSNTQDLLAATQCPSFDVYINYEAFETVGDSVLKFLTSAFLFAKFPWKDENQLTRERIQLIKNDYLSILAFKADLHFALQSKERFANQWRPPYVIKLDGLKSAEPADLQQLQAKKNYQVQAKNLADCYEAMLGVSFVHKYDFKSVLKLLFSFGQYIQDKIQDNKITESVEHFLIPPQYYSKINQIIFNEKLTYVQLLRSSVLYQSKKKNNQQQQQILTEKNNATIVNQKKQNKNKSKKQQVGIKFNSILQFFSNIQENLSVKYSNRNIQILKVINELETKVLQYRFKNKLLIIHALNYEKKPDDFIFSENYESLEFLGDAVFEVFVIGNGYKLLADDKVYVTPEIMNHMKICLLSNAFMARMSVQLGLHKYFLNLSQSGIDDIQKFIQAVKFKVPFKQFVRHQTTAPKLLGDVWESIAGAIIIDGGWKAFTQVFGKILAPYLKFFSVYYQRINTNICELLDLKTYQLEKEKITYKSIKISRLNNQTVEVKDKSSKTYLEQLNSQSKNISQDFIYKTEIFQGNKKIHEAFGETKKNSKEIAAFETCLMKNFITNK